MSAPLSKQVAAEGDAESPAPERNSFDRCFFNGHTDDGSMLFAAALGTYPGLGVVDASLSVLVGDVQHNVRSSRLLRDDLRTEVGPILVETVERDRRYRIRVESSEGVAADLTFEADGPAIEEPPFLRNSAEGVVVMDYLRTTQHGSWTGAITVDGRTIRIDPRSHHGVRDRSRGVRPLPGADSRGPRPGAGRRFCWLWIPCRFEERLLLVDVQGDGRDAAYHRSGRVIDRTTGGVEEVAIRCELEFAPGEPHLSSARLTFDSELDGSVEVRLEPLVRWSMSGVGYQHPVWGFGIDHGPRESAVDRYDLSSVDWSDPLHRHVQAVSRATWTSGNHSDVGGGTVEQLFIPEPLVAPGVLDVRVAP